MPGKKIFVEINTEATAMIARPRRSQNNPTRGSENHVSLHHPPVYSISSLSLSDSPSRSPPTPLLLLLTSRGLSWTDCQSVPDSDSARSIKQFIPFYRFSSEDHVKTYQKDYSPSRFRLIKLCRLQLNFFIETSLMSPKNFFDERYLKSLDMTFDFTWESRIQRERLKIWNQAGGKEEKKEVRSGEKKRRCQSLLVRRSCPARARTRFLVPSEEEGCIGERSKEGDRKKRKSGWSRKWRQCASNRQAGRRGRERVSQMRIVPRDSHETSSTPSWTFSIVIASSSCGIFNITFR